MRSAGGAFQWRIGHLRNTDGWGGQGSYVPAQEAYVGASVMGSRLASNTLRGVAERRHDFLEFSSEHRSADAFFHVADANPYGDQVRVERGTSRLLMGQDVLGVGVRHRQVVERCLMGQLLIEQDRKSLAGWIVGVVAN